MTVSSTTNRVSYSGNGSTTAFAFSHPFRLTADLVVTVRTTATGAESLKTEGSDYTVSGTADSGTGGYSSGTVTFGTAPASGTQVHIDRVVTRTQTSDFISGDGIPPASIEGALDKLSLSVQELDARFARTLLQPRTAANRDLVLPEPTTARAGQLLGVNSAGTAYEMRSDGSASLGWANVRSYGAVGDGTTNDSAAFSAAAATGATVFVPEGNYALSSSVTTGTAAWVFDPQARLTDWTKLDTKRGGFDSNSNGSNIWRLNDRVFVGSASMSDGKRTNVGVTTFINDAAGLNSHYLERSAQILSTSPWGGIGLTGATRMSDRYTYNGYSVWTSGQVVTAGAKRGYGGRLYTTAAGGTCGSTPLTHTTGSASDGGVTWTFDDQTYQVPIGVAGAAVQDVADGSGVWAGYFETVRTSGASTAFGLEIAIKNKGSDATPDPYNVLAGGSTIGVWFAGGGDATLGAPTNPSSSAISIGKNAHTWNRGIIFSSDSLTLDGASRSYAINMAQGHMIAWWRAAGSLGARIWSSVSTISTDVGIEFTDNTIRFIGTGGNIVGQVEAVASAANYIRQISQAAGSSPEIRAGGSDTNLDLKLTPKGTGNVQFGTLTASGDAAVSGYITIKDAGGTLRKLAVIT